MLSILRNRSLPGFQLYLLFLVSFILCNAYKTLLILGNTKNISKKTADDLLTAAFIGYNRIFLLYYIYCFTLSGISSGGIETVIITLMSASFASFAVS